MKKIALLFALLLLLLTLPAYAAQGFHVECRGGPYHGHEHHGRQSDCQRFNDGERHRGGQLM